MPGMAQIPSPSHRPEIQAVGPACLPGTGDTESPSGLQCDREGYGSMMSTWSGTARRLLLGFGAMVAIFGLASWVALSGLNRTQDAVARMKVAEEDVRVALQLASAVRDQYAHQAHTIIIGDESHLGFYTEAQRRVLELTRQLRRSSTSPEALATVDDIERASGELDGIFLQAIVPAVVRGDRAFVQERARPGPAGRDAHPGPGRGRWWRARRRRSPRPAPRWTRWSDAPRPGSSRCCSARRCSPAR